MSEDNVVPFRKRPLPETEMEVYRMMTRNWSAALRELILPEHFRQEQETPKPAR